MYALFAALPLLISTSDVKTRLAYQELDLARFFQKIERGFYNEAASGRIPYRNMEIFVKSRKGFVQEVDVHYKSFGDFSISDLPATVRRISITECGQNYQLETRLLPRELRTLNMESNHIFGTVDLQSLPHKIVKFDVKRNLITGPVVLSGLPPFLEIIDLSDNDIEQKVVYYEHIPEHIAFINLRNNKIGDIQQVDGLETDRRIYSYSYKRI